jgi:hypothetical protein
MKTLERFSRIYGYGSLRSNTSLSQKYLSSRHGNTGRVHVLTKMLTASCQPISHYAFNFTLSDFILSAGILKMLS